MNQLKQKVYGCNCNTCKALVCLIDQQDAVLQFSKSRAGRLCELAVVAEAGAQGIHEEQVVGARRAYAAHLGVILSGPISNSDEPVHILHAIRNSNHSTDAINRINIGEARASKLGKYSYLR